MAFYITINLNVLQKSVFAINHWFKTLAVALDMVKEQFKDQLQTMQEVADKWMIPWIAHEIPQTHYIPCSTGEYSWHSCVVSQPYLLYVTQPSWIVCLHRFNKQYHQAITKTLNCKEGWRPLPMRVRHWCASMNMICSFKFNPTNEEATLNDTSIWRRGGR